MTLNLGTGQEQKMGNNFFLTGPPRRGKSSLILDFLPSISGPVGGFVVQRMVLSGETVAFRLADLQQEPYLLTLPFRGRVSDPVIYQEKNNPRWTPVLSTFNQKGTRALQNAAHCSLVIMDELGIFEEEALPFQRAVLKCLGSSQPVLGVIKQKSSPFLDRVRGILGENIYRIGNPETTLRLERFLRERGLLKE